MRSSATLGPKRFFHFLPFAWVMTHQASRYQLTFAPTAYFLAHRADFPTAVRTRSLANFLEGILYSLIRLVPLKLGTLSKPFS